MLRSSPNLFEIDSPGPESGVSFASKGVYPYVRNGKGSTNFLMPYWQRIHTRDRERERIISWARPVRLYWWHRRSIQSSRSVFCVCLSRYVRSQIENEKESAWEWEIALHFCCGVGFDASVMWSLVSLSLVPGDNDRESVMIAGNWRAGKIVRDYFER